MQKIFNFIFLVSFLLSSWGHAQAPRRASRPNNNYNSEQGPVGTNRTVISGFIVDTQFFYGQSKAIADPADTTVDPITNNEFDVLSTAYTLKLGWVSKSGFYLGALYTQRQDLRAAVTINGHGAGAGIGFFGDNGFSARAFYRTGENYGSFSNGAGFSVEAAYLIKVSSRIFLGFTLTHLQVEYTKNSTITNFKKQSAKWTYPALTLAYVGK